MLKIDDADGFEADPAIDVLSTFENTHWGTREMTIRDPDGSVWSLQAKQ